MSNRKHGFNEKDSRFAKLINFINNYRIHIREKLQFQGIKDTLLGWALIALTFILRKDIEEPALLQFSFFIIYLSGALGVLLNVLFDSLLKGKYLSGIKELLISKKSDHDKYQSHLSVKQRFYFILVRAIIATTGWVGVNVASIYFGYIDNSAIFGSDALFYTFLCVSFLGQKLTFKEWLGILIAFSGIIFILLLDLTNVNRLEGIICGIAALYSAISFSIIFFMTSIIIRHDSPIRVTFYQSLFGSAISLLGFLVTIAFFNKNNFSFDTITWDITQNSIVLGVLYATALYRFLRAFLFTEPIIIAVLGYTLPIFVIIFELFFKGNLISSRNMISISLITVGCIVLVHEWNKKERKRRNRQSRPIYDLTQKK